jgi:tetratricopeptide (TPR) repeat protein
MVKKNNSPTSPLEDTQPIPTQNQIRRRKLAISCAVMSLVFVFLVGAFLLIAGPLIFRSLDEETQYRFVRRVPMLAGWQVFPTAPFQSLPTVEASANANVLALLATGTPLPPSVATSPTSVPMASHTITVPPTNAFNQNNSTALSTSEKLATTSIPTVTPPAPTPTAVPPATVVPVMPLPVSFHGTGYSWVPQTWNNCGPANLAQALEPFQWQGDQAVAAAYLKPNKDDKNVSPWQIVDYVNSQTTVRAITRNAGDLNLIKRLVSQKFPVILETGYSLPGEGWMGHYLTVIGYDNAKGLLYGLDTMLGDGPDNLGYPEKFAELDQRWKQFNRNYIVLYPAERHIEVANILGNDFDETLNAQHALSVAQSEAASKPNDPFAWFNVGSNYVALGRYKEAATAFDQAARVGGGLPYRMLWYQFAPYEAYYRIGAYKNMMTLINATLQTTLDVEETYYWRGMVEAAQGKTALAIKDFNRVLQYNSNFTPATDALASVQNGSFVPPAGN